MRMNMRINIIKQLNMRKCMNTQRPVGMMIWYVSYLDFYRKKPADIKPAGFSVDSIIQPFYKLSSNHLFSCF